MINIETPEIQFAINAVRRATSLVQLVQTEMVSSAITKDDHSPVTVADFAAQALVGAMLDEAFSDDPMVGEEDSSVLQTLEKQEFLARITQFVSRFEAGATPDKVCQWIDRGSAESGPRFWTLDPIDGTKGFLRGDQYAVALALIVDGDVKVAALGCPNIARLTGDHLGGLILAARDQGAWTAALDGDLEFIQLSVSDRADPTQARLMRSFESGHTNIGQIDYFADALGVQADPVRMDSQAKYAVLAGGHGEIYLRLLSPKRRDYREKIWDQAAGSLVTEEAGGRVTDLDGKPLDFTQGRTMALNRGICASNGHLHQAALEAIKAIQA